jgi:alpha-mannosidase
MNLRECLFLLPGNGLDDFPRSLAADQADELLAGWVALWHPQLIAAIRTAPRWQQATYPPADLNDLLLVLPSISESVLKSGFEEEVIAAGSVMLRARAPWTEFQSELLSATGLTASNATIDSLQLEFAALGYAFLQVQLMTRQLRYTSNLDELLFSDQALQAAQAAVADDRETAERMLQSCFDQLGQERDHYYSLDVSLIDVTLLAPTTLGNSLKKQLSTPHPPTSVLANASLVCKLNETQPESMQLLNSALAQRSATLVGGLDRERPHPLMSFDAVRRDLARARQTYAALGVPQPKVFSRYTFGVVP